MRLPFTALLLYVGLDLANPLMPGAMCFDPDQSVEAVSQARPVVPAAAAIAPAPPPAGPRPISDQRVAARAGRSFVVSPGEGIWPRARTALSRSVPPSVEDH